MLKSCARTGRASLGALRKSKTRKGILGDSTVEARQPSDLRESVIHNGDTSPFIGKKRRSVPHRCS